MAAQVYQVRSGPSVTGTTPVVQQSLTATTTKTLIQLYHPNNTLRVVSWGVEFSTPLVTAAVCELCTTTTVAATVTAYVANDVTLFSDPLANVPGLTLSTSTSGYNASAEGTIVAPVRQGSTHLVYSSWFEQFPLGREFEVAAATVLRVRATSPTAVTSGVHAFVIFEV